MVYDGLNSGPSFDFRFGLFVYKTSFKFRKKAEVIVKSKQKSSDRENSISHSGEERLRRKGS